MCVNGLTKFNEGVMLPKCYLRYKTRDLICSFARSTSDRKCGEGRSEGKFLEGWKLQCTDKEGFPQTKFCGKEGFPQTKFCDKEGFPQTKFCGKEGFPQTKFCDKEGFPQTKFYDKEGFPRVPLSTSTIGLLQICLQAKWLIDVTLPPAPPPMATPLNVATILFHLDLKFRLEICHYEIKLHLISYTFEFLIPNQVTKVEIPKSMVTSVFQHWQVF